MREGIGRHWEMVRQSLALDRAASAERLERRETEFLPAALEIIESPPSPVGRLLLWLLCGFLGIALLWSILAKVDIIVAAPGRIAPLDSVQTVSWGGSGDGAEGTVGVVRAVHVAEGDNVRRGQLLISLDSTIVGADSDQARRGLDSAQVEAARSRALIDYLAGGRAEMRAVPGLSPEEMAVQRQLVRSTIGEYEARAASIAQQQAEKQAQLQSAQRQRAMLADTLALLDKEIGMRSELAAKGYQSKVSLYQIQQVRIERLRDMEQQQSLAAQAGASLADLALQRQQLRAALSRGSLADLSKASDDASLRERELAKAQRRSALLQIRAPVDGTVEQLRVRTVGGTVQAAQPLVSIVPSRGPLFVEALVPNAEIGFVRLGQRVQVKVDAYPFTDYGMLHGVVHSIGRDSVQGLEEEARPDPAGPTGFKVRVRLSDTMLRSGDCSPGSRDCHLLRLTSGMRVQAEIRTGRRRIIQYLLSPLVEAGAEAGRER
ncbi:MULTISPECIES: HlyD family type I secretion periplasmic adaptor subunit [unclassified Sphingobium]|uniref:HlyD family type I secretion periplasmic adaptor subunit n=1 Tax=unclassified Sphingobium TaxID=2611147 RepID=UPI0035A63DEC